MEYIGHNSLNSYLKSKSGRKLIEDEGKIIFRQLCESLKYCQEHKIVHRDIKLENILLDSNKKIKLIDFGFSIIIPKDKKLSIFCGTPSYMSPEIVSKKEYFGFPADIWALGIVLYVILCGSFPFKG